MSDVASGNLNLKIGDMIRIKDISGVWVINSEAGGNRYKLIRPGDIHDIPVGMGFGQNLNDVEFTMVSEEEKMRVLLEL